MSDSPRVRDQVPLTTSTGRSWLVVGGLIGALSVVMLVVMRELRPLGASMVGIVTTVVLVLLLLAAHSLLPYGRGRLTVMAVLTIAISLCFFVVAGTITLTELQSPPATVP